MGFSSLISGAILSPNYNVRTNATFNPTGKILKITPHHAAFVGTAEQIAGVFTSTARQASCNYAIGNDGKIIGVVDETNRAWTSSSPENDYLAITIEVSNSATGGDWPISDAAYKSLVALCVDICKRHNIEELHFVGNSSGNLTAHRMFASTICPGPYLYSKFPQLADDVNDELKEDEPMTASEKQAFEALQKKVEALEAKCGSKYDWFTDSKAKSRTLPSYFNEDIKWLYQRGFIKGNEKGALDLSYNMARILVIVSRALQKIIK